MSVAMLTTPRGRQQLLRDVGIYLVLILAALVVLLPYIWMLSTSLKPNDEVFSATPRFIPSTIRWENYPEVLRRYQLATWLSNSVLVAVAETLGVVATSILAGYAFGRLRFWGRDVVFFMFLGAMMVPIQVTLIPTFLIVKWLGWIDTYQGLIVPRLCGFFGVFLMRQFFLNFPADIEDAAFTDGASRWRALWQIVLPLSAPAAAALAIFSFTASWNEFLWPLVILNTEEMKTVQLGLASMKGELVDWGLIMAGTALSAVPLLVMYLILQRYFIQGVVMSGLKG
jgi:multiple sugar transport system permease protein